MIDGFPNRPCPKPPVIPVWLKELSLALLLCQDKMVSLNFNKIWNFSLEKKKKKSILVSNPSKTLIMPTKSGYNIKIQKCKIYLL